MFTSRKVVSRLTRPTRQAKLGANHVRPFSTRAPRIRFHDGRSNRTANAHKEKLSDVALSERELHPFPWQLERMQRLQNETKGRRHREKDYAVPLMTLRDMCTCPRCVDQSTRQKLFSTVEIPPDISLRNVTELPNGVEIQWSNDLPGFDESHKSVFPKEIFEAMAARGSSKTLPPLPARKLWTDSQFREEVPDLTYEAYMEDDTILYKALQQLHSHGLLFLKDVPESAESVSRIAQRIGPLKNTFYGETWDVRSVPKAKNVAYTSQDLGFHMDLMYMEQPPHLQFLHCIRSSAVGGASLFTDSFKAVTELFSKDEDAFCELEKRLITFHYDHIDSHYYQQSRPLIELAPLRFGNRGFPNYKGFRAIATKINTDPRLQKMFKLEDHLEAVSWAPPFQAPFQTWNSHLYGPWQNLTAELENHVRYWYPAARKFNDIIHREENIHERMMKPGECVLFDNRRVLHARRAFEVADAGKERWLRGAYLDKDPFMSKLRVLANRFEKAQRKVDSQPVGEDHREAAAQAA